MEKKEKLFSLKNKVKIVFVIVIVLLFGFLFFKLGINYQNELITKEKTTKFGLEDVGELVTETCYTTVLEDSKVDKDFFNLFKIPFSESRQIFSYDFQVDAAVDFREIKYEINSSNKEINIILPHARIYKTTLNPASFKVYLDSSSIFSRIDLDMHNEAVKKMQEKAESDCINNKLLETADLNAKRLLSVFFSSKDNFKDYKINYNYKEDNK